LIRAARAASVYTLDEVIAELKAAGGESAAPVAAEPPVRVAPSLVPSSSRSPAPAMPSAPPPEKKTIEPNTSPATTGDELALLTNHWTQICAKVGSAAPLARAYVRDTRPAEVSELSCVIGCDPEFAGHVPYLQHAKCVMAFQHAIADVLGRKVTVHVKQLGQLQTGKLPSDTPVAGAGDTHAGNKEGPAPAKSKSLKRKWSEEPSVKRTLEMFNGTISDIRE
jgi:hypothetical protein